MRSNRTSVAVLIGTIAAALQDSTDAFAPRVPMTTQSMHPTCRCSTTEASLFRRKKKADAANEVDQSPEPGSQEENSNRLQNSRRNFGKQVFSATAATASLLPLRSYASSDKQLNLSNDDLKQIILSDIVDKSFLVSADLTRSVYDESAIFTDEIGVYTMDKWVEGTKPLFIFSGSRLSLVGDVDVSPSEVSFRFDEELMFNIPFKPVCALTGKVVLTRDENTGLITSYREYWDQSVIDVYKTVKFGKKA